MWQANGQSSEALAASPSELHILLICQLKSVHCKASQGGRASSVIRIGTLARPNEDIERPPRALELKLEREQLASFGARARAGTVLAVNQVAGQVGR